MSYFGMDNKVFYKIVFSIFCFLIILFPKNLFLSIIISLPKKSFH